MVKWCKALPASSTVKGPALSIGHDRFSNVYSSPSDVRTAQQAGPSSYDIIQAIYYSVPAFQRAAKLLAGMCASVPVKYQKETGSRITQARRGEGPFIDTWEWVNDRMSTSELIQHYAMSMVLTNSACFVIDKTPAEYRTYEGASEFSLIPLETKYVTPVNGAKGLSYIVYTDPKVDGGQPLIFKASSVLYVKGVNPFETYLPSTEVGSTHTSANIYTMIRKGISNNNANPSTFSGAITSKDKIDIDARRRLRNELRNVVQGSGDAYRLLLLDEGMEYKPVSVTNEDRYMEQAKGFVTDEFMQALNMYEKLVTGTGDGKELEQLAFMAFTFTVIPMMKALLAEYRKKMGQYGRGIAILPDETRSAILQKYRLDVTRTQVAKVNVGAMTLNEMRQEDDYPPYPPEWDWLANTPLYALMKVYGVNPGSDTSPSLTLPGSMGGRDQSDGGEAQLIDETGSR